MGGTATWAGGYAMFLCSMGSTCCYTRALCGSSRLLCTAMIDAGASRNGCSQMGGFVLHNHRENSNIWMWTSSPRPLSLTLTGVVVICVMEYRSTRLYKPIIGMLP